MRRIYESRALEYDDEDPHAPKRRDDDEDPGPRTVDWSKASHALLPERVRRWAIAVDVETDRGVYASGDTVSFRVTFRNRLPFPVSLRTTSPIPWTWSVDGLDEASHVAGLPEETGLFEFDRAERKVFTRTWPQRVRQDGRTWTPADRGDHTLGVRVVTSDAVGKGLAAETTFRIE